MFKDFWRAIFARWFTAMSGPLSVPAAIASTLASNNAAKLVLGMTALACFVFTAFWVWRTERLKVIELEQRLDPKLTLQFVPENQPFVTRTRLGASWHGFDGAIYVRVVPKCNAQVTGCLGVLERVMKLQGSDWVPTAYREAHNLMWSNHSDPADRAIRLDRGIDQCLDVFFVDQSESQIHPTLVGGMIPNNAVDVFNGGGTFRFDVSVVGDGNAHASKSLKVTTGATWDALTVEAVAE